MDIDTVTIDDTIPMEQIAPQSSNHISSSQCNKPSFPMSRFNHHNPHNHNQYTDCGVQQNQFFNQLSSSTSLSRPLRPHSTPATLIWLEDNYELADGVCIPRSVLYMHYVDFCTANSVQPVNAASFGKIIRQQFPQLTTRRLGTRGQSRYHYYGIAIRETSTYYHISYSKKSGINNTDPLKRESRDHLYKQPLSPLIHNSRTRGVTILPEFPNLKNIVVPPNLDHLKISTFLMMYRTHCQRILDTIMRANFDEVQTFLLHFWQGVPSHLTSILESNSVINLIGVCDSILYKTIANVLLPTVLQTLPDSVSKIMRQFATELDNWLKMALFNLPESLRMVKLELAQRFGQLLKRQSSLGHLAQASRMVINNTEITVQMLHDWRLIDIETICGEILYDNISTMHTSNGNGIVNGECDKTKHDTIEIIRISSQQFERFLMEEVPIETYLEFLESLVNKCILSNKTSVRRLSRQFLLLWSAFGSRVIRDMTLHSAASFGSFHLLRLMFDDYVLYLVEYVHMEEQMRRFLKHVSTDEPPQFSDTYLEGSEINSENINTGQVEYEPVTSTSEFSMTEPNTQQGQRTDQIITAADSNNDNAEHNFGYENNSYQNQSVSFYPQIDETHRLTNNYNSWYNSTSVPTDYGHDFNILGNNESASSTPSSSMVYQFRVDTTNLVVFNSDYERHA